MVVILGKVNLLFLMLLLTSSCADFRIIELPSEEYVFSKHYDYFFIKALYLQKVGNETLHIALVLHESKMNKNAVCNNGKRGKDYGYYQLNSRAFRHTPIWKLKNPMTNIEIGSRHLNKCLQFANGDYETALNYYHLGKNSVDNMGFWNENYVKSILHYKNIIDKKYQDELKYYKG